MTISLFIAVIIRTEKKSINLWVWLRYKPEDVESAKFKFAASRKGTTAEEVGQALVWLICVCVGKLRNAIIFSARSSEVKVSNFKQP